jgi:hypothetical protein
MADELRDVPVAREPLSDGGRRKSGGRLMGKLLNLIRGWARRSLAQPQPEPLKRSALVAAAIVGLSPSIVWGRPAPRRPITAVPPPPGSAPAGVPTIYVQNNAGVLLQVGADTDACWIEDGVWNAGRLMRGTYDGVRQYEQYTGRDYAIGPSGEVAGRLVWKWPLGTTEVKSYMSIIKGNKPGYYNESNTPGGHSVKLLDDTISTVSPCGKTPGSFFPLTLPLQSLFSKFNYHHLATPTGRGHLTYDVWLQSSPQQFNRFNDSPITHEIQIPVDYWGLYGAYPHRNPDWYDHDAVIDGFLYHVYAAKGADGALRADFGNGWKFIAFEPDGPMTPGRTINLAAFINYCLTRKDVYGTPWMIGTEYVVSVELGVEPVEGTGDLVLYDYKVYR